MVLRRLATNFGKQDAGAATGHINETIRQQRFGSRRTRRNTHPGWWKHDPPSDGPRGRQLARLFEPEAATGVWSGAVNTSRPKPCSWAAPASPKCARPKMSSTVRNKL